MEALERHVNSPDWITLILLLILVILVITRNAFPQRFSQFILLFATDKYLLLKGKNPKIFHPFNLLLFTVNILSVGLFIFLFFVQVLEEPVRRPEVLYLRIITAYAALVLLKFSLEKILANIISLDQRLNFYLFNKLSYRNFMSLILLPISAFFVYAWSPSDLVFYLIIGILLLLNLVALISIYRKDQQYILSNWFYFILYLCALEIGPYFILYKLVTKL